MPSLALEVQRGGIPGLPGATPSPVGLKCSSEPVSSPSMLLLVYRRLSDDPERFWEVLVASLKKLFGCDPGRVLLTTHESIEGPGLPFHQKSRSGIFLSCQLTSPFSVSIQIRNALPVDPCDR